MHARVEKDASIRTIVIRIADADERHTLSDVSATWRKMPRLFRPDSVRIMVEDGKFRSVAVSGQLILKSGQPSDNPFSRDSSTWSDRSYGVRGKFEDAPQWLREMVADALAGITTFVDVVTS